MASRVRLQLVLLVLALAIALPLIARATNRRAIALEIKEKPTISQSSEQDGTPLPGTDAEWKQRLTPEQYTILPRKGTETAFTGKYWHTKAKGVYRCAGCGQPLFSSDAKFDSGTGWPSFWTAYAPNTVATGSDDSLWMHRTEVLCNRCGGHRGATFGAGCFWCTEAMFQRLKGVKSVVVHFRINCGVTFDASQLIRAISWPKARASSQQSGRLRVADTSPLSLTFPGRSCESSAASVPESRPRRISLARG
jgi:peptide-methionine (R)-S-oxide reductase